MRLKGCDVLLESIYSDESGYEQYPVDNVVNGCEIDSGKV